MNATYNEFFRKATGFDPYPYQSRMAEGPWPDLLRVPTGLGKTAAVTLSWLYRRVVRNEQDMPRRLVWCLPMRTLAEQASANIALWLREAQWLAEPGEGGVSVHLLMGGAEDVTRPRWTLYPEEPQVIVGTQDMLVSRALMRGYGMSRYAWPVHFALLNNDALWVFDEVQLMGAARPSSAQLEAFRRMETTERRTRSLWVSATLEQQWLETVDSRTHAREFAVLELSNEDRGVEKVRARVGAHKTLRPANTRFEPAAAGKNAADYISALAEEVTAAHDSQGQTLVILNTVDRAQALYEQLKGRVDSVPLLLLHARFRPPERNEIEKRLRDDNAADGRIVVATQAVEAGVDISSRRLITELAPWVSLVQRFGRCNRSGEYDEAEIRWIDMSDEEEATAPYDVPAVSAARSRLESLKGASPDELPRPEPQDSEDFQVIRRRDLLELFNTDPDLSGFDIDISPYVRDPGGARIQVYWRSIDDQPGEQQAPSRDELCSVGIGAIGRHLKSGKRSAWAWDPLAGHWRRIDASRVRPGQTLLLAASEGGYREDSGFIPGAKEVVPTIDDTGARADQFGMDPDSEMRRAVFLRDHTDDVLAEAERLSDRLGISGAVRNALLTAARWHDVGKAHEAFQRAVQGEHYTRDGEPLAKSNATGRLNYRVTGPDGSLVERPHFRHELASALAWLSQQEDGTHANLVAYMVAAHHGKVRTGLRALPEEKEPPEAGRLFARGIWDGDTLPAVSLTSEQIPCTRLHLDLMQIGFGEQGASWSARVAGLLEEYGPFRLAWLEALVRIADWRASSKEETRDADRG
jgi:CRISPR-associated endonuclease/helicase Cas3